MKASVPTKARTGRKISLLLIGHVYATVERHVIFEKYNSNEYIWAEPRGQVRVMDGEENALRRQAPQPLICRTALSGSVCMAAPAPHYSFSLQPLSVCWWKTLPLKDSGGVFLRASALKPSSGLTSMSHLGGEAKCCTQQAKISTKHLWVEMVWCSKE